MDDLYTLSAQGISVTLDLAAGHLRRLEMTRDGHVITPLHTAPWIDDPAVTEDESIAPNLRHLSGDFFCAPFGASDLEPAPPHGWTANSAWRHIGTHTIAGGTEAVFRLDRQVMGAVVEKTLTLRDGHPFLYETHTFFGGNGAIPVANHAMVRFAAAGRLYFSPKTAVETPDTAPEPNPAQGRSLLAYPQRSTDPARMALAAGGVADITRYPFAEKHEDIVVLVERPGHALGWVAVHRPDRGDLFVSLKNPVQYPTTILWFSNGGRDYAPWHSRHTGVLGIEEGRTYGVAGHAASVSANPFDAQGIPTALTLVPGGHVEVRNVIGAFAATVTADVDDVTAANGRLVISFSDGTRSEHLYDNTFLVEA